MAKHQNTYAKRKREMEKKLKAEEKRVRRQKRKETGGDGAADETPAVEPQPPADDD
jgi:hypothetical protein